MFHLLLQACGAALVNAAIPSGLMVGIAYASMRMRTWSATTRYFAWWIALSVTILLPISIALRPPVKSEPVPTSLRVHDIEIAGPQQPVIKMAASEPSAFNVTIAEDVIGVLCCCWMGCQLLQFAYGFFGAMRLKRRTQGCPDGALLALAVDVGAQIGLRRRVSFCISDRIASPAAVGYLCPAILLPRDLVSRLNVHELRQVLAHELAHMARYDDWAIAVQRFIQALLAFHPLVRFISRRMDLDREIACDDRVIASLETGQYAACLTKIAELRTFRASGAVAVPLLARHSNLGKRIEAMFDRTRSHLPALSTGRALAFCMLGIAVGLVGLRVPALLAAPLFDQGGDQIGPILLTTPDGLALSFEGNGNEKETASVFPNSTIVFKEHNQSYIIRDRSTVEAANRLLQHMHELERKQNALDTQQRKLGEQQRELGDRYRTLADHNRDAAVRRSIEAEMRALKAKLRALAKENASQGTPDVQAQVAEIEGQIGDLQAKLGDEDAKLGAMQGEIGQEQGKLGQEQGRLGEMQGKIGEQQAEEAKHIERELRALIESATKKGLAHPLQ